MSPALVQRRRSCFDLGGDKHPATLLPLFLLQARAMWRRLRQSSSIRWVAKTQLCRRQDGSIRQLSVYAAGQAGGSWLAGVRSSYGGVQQPDGLL